MADRSMDMSNKLRGANVAELMGQVGYLVADKLMSASEGRQSSKPAILLFRMLFLQLLLKIILIKKNILRTYERLNTTSTSLS
jgi:hypothetical protein